MASCGICDHVIRSGHPLFSLCLPAFKQRPFLLYLSNNLLCRSPGEGVWVVSIPGSLVEMRQEGFFV
eukprot:994283-Amorphochlora_amoeboformis.AAC.1